MVNIGNGQKTLGGVREWGGGRLVVPLGRVHPVNGETIAAANGNGPGLRTAAEVPEWELVQPA